MVECSLEPEAAADSIAALVVARADKVEDPKASATDRLIDSKAVDPLALLLAPVLALVLGWVTGSRAVDPLALVLVLVLGWVTGRASLGLP